jgi:hypothetical protein
VLASLLAQNNYLPHLYALRDDRQVCASGIWTLAILSGALLVAVGRDTGCEHGVSGAGEDQPAEPADLRMCRPRRPGTMTVTC